MVQKRLLDDDESYSPDVDTVPSSWPTTPASSASTGAGFGCSTHGDDEHSTGSSPSKRTRCVPPPTRLGPLLFDASGSLAPSTIAPQPSNRPGVRRLIPRDAPLRVHLAYRTIDTSLSIFLSSKARRLVFLFENDTERIPESFIAMLPRYSQYLLVINDSVPTPNSLGVPAIEDPTGGLARECRVLDPVGTGRNAAPCLVYVEDDELRGTVMVGRSHEQVYRMMDMWTQ